jgi:hypothetical protein
MTWKKSWTVGTLTPEETLIARSGDEADLTVRHSAGVRGPRRALDELDRYSPKATPSSRREYSIWQAVVEPAAYCLVSSIFTQFPGVNRRY